MFDVAAFEVLRSPARAELDSDQKLDISGPFVTTVASALEADPHADTRTLREAFLRTHTDPLPFADGTATPDTPLHVALGTLGQLERWLVQQRDEPTGDDLDKKIHDLQKTGDGNGGSGGDDKGHDLARGATTTVDVQSELSDWIVAWLTVGGESARVGRATRLLLVAALAAEPTPTLTSLTSAQVWDRLNRRIPVLPASLSALFTAAKVELVREASVADLHVVRSEWRCYVPGEIASIRNVMAGETFHSKQKQINEQETTVSQSSQSTVSTEVTNEQTQQTELSQQVSSEIQAQINGFARFEYTQGLSEYSHYAVNGGVDGGLSVTRSEQQASRIARQAVSRAVAKVESQTRESRLQRTLTRSEDLKEYSLTNSTNENHRGVYRWVDRIDRYQMFRYPNRLQLEFQLPEPAEFYRWRTRQAQERAGGQAPPAWDDLKPEQITEQNAMQLAIKYRASNLPVLPDASVSVVQVLAGTPDGAGLPTDDTSQWQAPEIIKDLEIAVPDGYVATKVTYSGMATAARAVWRREDTGHLSDEDLEGFHTVFANVLVGTSSTGYLQGGRFATQLSDSNTVQGWGDSSDSKVQYGEAMLHLDSGGQPVSVPINPGAVAKLKVGVHVVGAATAALTFTVECDRTQQRYTAWQYAVYDALYSAWSQWNSDWESAQTRDALVQALPSGQSSPMRNAQIVRDEIKRQVVSWLLDESPFHGRPALQPPQTDPNGAETWRSVDLDEARSVAPTIQFLEQAFEWSNMSYIFYPYYWADAQRWDDLADLSDGDPDFERFLSAGSARVVVPARPGMEAAVHHWLLYLEPFLGQPMPLPGEPMYVSVATEVRDLTLPPEDGEPGESWESRTGTTLIWLDDATELPKNTSATLGAPPHEPAVTLCH